MKIGQNIKVKAYGGEVIIRRVVQLGKDIVYICKEEEYQKAQKEKREPICVGFNTKSVVEEN